MVKAEGGRLIWPVAITWKLLLLLPIFIFLQKERQCRTESSPTEQRATVPKDALFAVVHGQTQSSSQPCEKKKKFTSHCTHGRAHVV